MSFILDALRKSEAERSQQQTPGVVSATYAPRSNSNGRRWVPLVIALLLLNAIVIGFLLLRDEPVEPAEQVAVAAAAPPPLAAAPPRAPVRSLAREVTLAAEEATGQSAGRAAGAPGTEAEPAAPGRSDDSDTARPAASSGEATGGSRIQESLPSFQQLALSGVISVPPLHLDMHVYSPERASRFVFINMNKYKEGDRIEEGPGVEEITESGVILSHQGSRFILDRE